MLMKDDKKSTVTLIASRLGGSEPTNVEDLKDKNKENVDGAISEMLSPESDDDVGAETAAEEIMDAFKAGDSKALLEALKALLAMVR